MSSTPHWYTFTPPLTAGRNPASIEVVTLLVCAVSDDRQREELVRELLKKATVSGNQLVSIEPRKPYKPIFACIVVERGRNCTPKPLQENQVSMVPSGEVLQETGPAPAS